jgi:hypothetical protein
MVTKINFPTSVPTIAVARKITGSRSTNVESTSPNKDITQVNISSASANKLLNEQTSTVKFFSGTSALAHRDPEFAAKLAYNTATEFDLALVDISGGINNVRYVQTGTLQTPENSASFERLASEVRDKKLALYQEEKNKGTPDADIYDKLIELLSQQSEEFRNGAGFEFRSNFDNSHTYN